MCTVKHWILHTQRRYIYRILSVLPFLYITTWVNAIRFLKVVTLKYAHTKRNHSSNMEGKARKKKDYLSVFGWSVFCIFVFFFLLLKPSETHIWDQNSYWKQEHLPSITLIRHTACFLLWCICLLRGERVLKKKFFLCSFTPFVWII